jgi:anthranilate phosphoribosyltransferase
MLNKYITKLLNQNNLTVTDSYLAAKALFQENDEALIASFLMLLHAKGETSDELLGFHQALSENCTKLNLNLSFVDIVGSGGDNAGTVNISTGAGLLLAACDVPVVKHGNRAVSSKCGSADVLAELGFNLNLSEAQLLEQLQQKKFAFCFAPHYYPHLVKFASLRKRLPCATIFNLLGPLLNPAGRDHLLLGVYHPRYVDILAETLFKLGTSKSLVFHGNGLDELSCLGNIDAKLVTREGITNYTINLAQLGLAKTSLDSLAGGDSLYNSQLLTRTLNGQATSISDSLALNAGAGLFIYGKCATLLEGVELAQQRLIQGNNLTLHKLQQIVLRKYQFPLKRKSMQKALLAKDFAVISEIKRASPSAGVIAEISDPVSRAQQYVNLGATAISVLTDEGFQGSMADLRQVSQALAHTNIPVLCKDFMLTPPQIAEAAANGADVVLLIVQVLKQRTLAMAEFAHSFGLEVLVEVHNASELDYALAAGADIIGVNQRDLTDFSMHPQQFKALIDLIPPHQVKVAESGIKTREQALSVLALGYDGVLVGEALSRLANPAEFFGLEG